MTNSKDEYAAQLLKEVGGSMLTVQQRQDCVVMTRM